LGDKFNKLLTVFSTVLPIVSQQVRTESDFIELANNVPLERLASALDFLGDESLESDFEITIRNYESFLAAKSHSELETKSAELIEEFRLKADAFGAFVYRALHSKNLDQQLVQYLAI